MNPSVHVLGLTKSYGTFHAVKGVDFEIFPGEVFGLLGPNGAGKTTTVEILEGLRPRNSGDVAVLGFDPGLESARIKDRIGVCLQATRTSPGASLCAKAMRLFASLYSRTVDGDALLERLMLWEKRDEGYGRLSGGQKQRLALALALVNDPQMLFLMLVFPGPTVHRELQLWVEAGIQPAVALQAATWNAARLLRADARIGLVTPGRDANLLVVDGDPTRDISATERISMVVLKGERVRRVDLFDETKNPL